VHPLHTLATPMLDDAQSKGLYDIIQSMFSSVIVNINYTMELSQWRH